MRIKRDDGNVGVMVGCVCLDCQDKDGRIHALEAALRFYVDAFPAFRSKPVGAPGSIERQAQDVHIAEEDKARIALGTASEMEPK